MQGKYFQLWEMQQGNIVVRDYKEDKEEIVCIDENEMCY
jgi:ATP-binding cassette subfamily B protein